MVVPPPQQNNKNLGSPTAYAANSSFRHLTSYLPRPYKYSFSSYSDRPSLLVCSRSVQATSLGFQHNERLVDIRVVAIRDRLRPHNILDSLLLNICPVAGKCNTDIELVFSNKYYQYFRNGFYVLLM